MKEFYEIYVDEVKICSFKNRESAHQYLREKHAYILPYLEYEPIAMGNLEVWQNPTVRIEIRRSFKGKMDIHKLLNDHLKNIINNNTNENIKNEVKEINTSIAMPCTPRRTKIITKNDKKETAEEGKIIIVNDEEYIGKKGKDGKVRWAKYYKKNYETVANKRQAPKEMAKNFKEGTQKKGENGQMWIVKKQKNGSLKWFKK